MNYSIIKTPPAAFSFEVLHRSKKSRARVGRIHTPHGVIETPAFVGVGTNGTLKGMDNICAADLGLQLMFCNTYHLMVQPGAATIKQAGGIHRFINRQGPIITDSGGFQIFSLAYGGVACELKSKGTKQLSNSVLKLSEDGVVFRSYRDGQLIFLSPETSIAAQKDIGADIMISFDELPPYHIDPRALRRSFDRTHRWAERSLAYHRQHRSPQALYGVVHGGTDKQLRALSCDLLTRQPFDGYAIGGSFGKTREEMFDMLTWTVPRLPDDKPNHLLGIADIPSLERSIPLGIDTFDSAHPTKAARHGLLFTKRGSLRVIKSGHATLARPIEDDCLCYTCRHYTIAYLCHLFKAHEASGLALATIHNVYFMNRFMDDYRNKILSDQI